MILARLLLACFALLLLHSPAGGSVAELGKGGRLPTRFQGDWRIDLIKQPGYPWWKDYKYPVRLVVRERGISFTNQFGKTCSLKLFFYDPEVDSLVFQYCGPSKGAWQSYFLARLQGDGRLVGEVRTHKRLFQWEGRNCKTTACGPRVHPGQ